MYAMPYSIQATSPYGVPAVVVYDETIVEHKDIVDLAHANNAIYQGQAVVKLPGQQFSLYNIAGRQFDNSEET